MKKFTAYLIAVIAFSVSASAQGRISHVLDLLRGKDAVSCSYQYRMNGNMPMEGDGVAVICGHKYYAKGNGIENYCDGKSVWTVDRSAKEVYIESAGGDIASNIEKFLGGIRDFKYDGSSLSCRIVKKEQGLDLEFKAQGIKTVPASEDGTVYSFDVSALDSSWVISDLR